MVGMEIDNEAIVLVLDQGNVSILINSSNSSNPETV